MTRKQRFLFILLILILFVFPVNGYAEINTGKITLRDGARIYYEAMGDPQHQNILFIHGWSCSSLYWQKQLKGLSSKYYTVAIDLRGHGRSDKPSSGYTLGYMAKDIHEVIEKLKLKDVFLIGWSMGGSIVFEYFKQFRGEHLKGICIVDIGPYSWKTNDYPVGYMDYNNRLKLTRKHTMAYQETKKEEIDFIEKMFIQKPDSHMLDQLKAEYKKAPAYVRSLLILDLFCSDYRDVLEQINLPTLILRGSWHKKEKDDPVGKYMNSKIRNSRFVRFYKSGHCPFLEETDKFNRVLSEFIEANR
mgnify:CR=1 FL=1